MRRHSRWLLLEAVTLLLFVALLACDPNEVATPGSVEDVMLKPGLVIGTANGSDHESFGAVTGVLGDEAGRIYVLDSQASAVRVFDSTGTFLFSIGRFGQGPGELSEPCCLAWGPDSLLWVREGGNARYSAFHIGDRSGEFVTTVGQRHNSPGFQTETTFSPQGHLIDIGDRVSGPPTVRERTRLYLDMTGNIDSLNIVTEPDAASLGRITVERQLPGGRGSAKLYFYQPYGPRYLVANGPRGVWADAVSSTYQITLRGGPGPVEIMGPDGEGPELSTAERTRAEERILQDVRRSGQNSLPLEPPPRKQPIASIYFDATGSLWVELSVPDGAMRRADVYTQEGRLVQRVRWPSDLQLATPAWPGNGRYALAIQTDSLGVQRIVRLTK